jgi:uncharacterized Zn finger protein
MVAYRYFDYYERTQPRKTRGGIKAQSKRGSFGQSWWARRWIEVLESFDIGARLSRGRSYARKGQVLSINVKRGTVTARVQGSRARPYRVDIDVIELTKMEWKTLAEALSTRAVFAARLLAGQMPENIENVFRDAGLSLFPTNIGAFDTDCSCPDWSNPCKHIAAVYYLLGEEFDRDPFLIFKLRGVEREELVELIGSQSAAIGESGNAEVPADPLVQEESEPTPPEPLSVDSVEFWGQPGAEGTFDAVHIPSISAALPGRLGSFPFWRGSEGFLVVLEDTYRKASPVGLDVLLGEGRRNR